MGAVHVGGAKKQSAAEKKKAAEMANIRRDLNRTHHDTPFSHSGDGTRAPMPYNTPNAAFLGMREDDDTNFPNPGLRLPEPMTEPRFRQKGCEDLDTPLVVAVARVVWRWVVVVVWGPEVERPRHAVHPTPATRWRRPGHRFVDLQTCSTHPPATPAHLWAHSLVLPCGRPLSILDLYQAAQEVYEEYRKVLKPYVQTSPFAPRPGPSDWVVRAPSQTYRHGRSYCTPVGMHGFA